jgi:glyoxylase-like metal-dependent hydrolase (beta-lactamase superfamily II)
MEVQELRPGLWRWTAPHPEWAELSSAYVEAAGALVLVDPLVPRDDEERFYGALDRDVKRLVLPVAIVLTNPWHRRSSAELAERYGATVHVAGESLPSGFEAYPGGMHLEDFVVFAPSHRVLFTGDTVVDGKPCPADWLAAGREHHLACLRRLLELEADLVVPSHGEPFPLEQLARALD